MNKLEEYMMRSYSKRTMEAIWHQGYIDTCYMSYNKASDLYRLFKEEIDQANYERHNELGDDCGDTGEYLEFYVASAMEYVARYLVELVDDDPEHNGDRNDAIVLGIMASLEQGAGV